jgi:hypothetical protein
MGIKGLIRDINLIVLLKISPSSSSNPTIIDTDIESPFFLADFNNQGRKNLNNILYNETV